jgi:hypothetical protein
MNLGIEGFRDLEIEKGNFDESVKSQKINFCHSGENRARSEALALSSYFNCFWTPAFAGVTGLGLFTEQSTFGSSINSCNCP